MAQGANTGAGPGRSKGTGPMLKLLFAAFLAAHGLIHASYLSPTPARTAGGPEWPFEMGRSWLVSGLGLDAGAVRLIGTVLIAVTVTAFLLAALSTAGWLVPEGWWLSLIVLGSVASAAQLLVFFHPWLVLGLAIDAVLIWLALVSRWTPTVAWGA
jgi:hypothetical protein